MIFDQDLPKFMWGEALMTTMYIQNISPHGILDNITPEEAFSRKNPCLDHLQIFGVLYTFMFQKKSKIR